MRCKITQKFCQENFLYFDLQIYGLNQAQTLTPLITLYVAVKKKNAASHSNIDLLKTAIQKEWNNISEEFISKAC